MYRLVRRTVAETCYADGYGKRDELSEAWLLKSGWVSNASERQ